MGTAIIGPASVLKLSIHANFSSLSFRDKEGVRIWLETGELREFKGEVMVHGTKDYRVLVSQAEGTAVGCFMAVEIFAITPFKGSANLMKNALSAALRERTLQ